jgi:3-deoxy-D-manno-octulosonic-acid transferase
MAMLSGTLPPSSSRLRGPARALLGPAYARLHHVAAIAAGDAERFGALGVPPARRSVMGDARFDQVWARTAGVDRASPHLAPLLGFAGVTLVAGSTWPADEARLLPAVAAVRAAGVALRLVLVPHEPTPAHLAESERALSATGLASVRLSAIAAEGDDARGELPEVVLVDRVGVLGDLYAAADVAYVGGGYGTAGLHSVLEPAAYGAPVLFGPRHANAREAAELVAAGAAWAADDGEALRARLLALATSPAARRDAGDAARAYVERGLGAAERGAEIVDRLMDAGASVEG